MAEYRSLTIWRIGAPLEAVYAVIHNSPRWTAGWPGVQKVEKKLELQLAAAFHFIFTEAEGFDEPDTNLASLEDNGTKYLCLNDACTEEDRQRLGYILGGGLSG